MGTKQDLLNRLKKSSGQWISGAQISKRIGISRTAIWKHINRLKSEGHCIDSAPKKGYRLTKAADRMDIQSIQEQLTTRVLGQPAVHIFQKTDSTNRQAKMLADQGAAEGTLVLADAQTDGRGRRGRTWFSPGGKCVYASLILRPPMAPSQAPQLTLMTAVAVARTLRRMSGLDANIKWPNDILVHGRKISGILTEISTEMDVVDYVVVGMGINVNIRKAEMPEQFRQTATSMHIETGTDFTRVDLVCHLLHHFETLYDQLINEGSGPIMEQWRRMTDIIGQRVSVDVMGTRHTGIVAAVDDDGVLVLRDDQDVIRRIFSGDVTRVRPKSKGG